MAIYAEYATLNSVRTLYAGTTATAQDTFILDLIRATSRDIDAQAGGRAFYPRIETRYYDVPADRQLDLDDDLLALTTLTNGDNNAIASTEYKLYPRNETPAYGVRLNESSAEIWEPDNDGNYESVIDVLGIWGYHHLYSHAWPDTTAILAAAITTTMATSTTCTTGLIYAGDLIKLDSEYLYVSAVATGASDTLTLVRGVNGSTAATHVISSIIYRWWNPDIFQLCAEAVVAKVRLKNSPVGDTVQVGDATFQTPKDVNAFVRKRLEGLGFVRTF